MTPFPARRGRAGLAPAASLLLAVGIGGYELGRRAAPQGVQAGPMAAVAALSGVATGGEAGLAAGGVARVLGSFETEAGLCRLISTEAATGQAERIVACREGGQWRVLLAVAARGADSYVTASGDAVEIVDGLLDRPGAGAPLSSEEERARLAD